MTTSSNPHPRRSRPWSTPVVGAIGGLVAVFGLAGTASVSARPAADAGHRALCVTTPGPALPCARGAARASATANQRAVPPLTPQEPARPSTPSRPRDVYERDLWRHEGVG